MSGKAPSVTWRIAIVAASILVGVVFFHSPLLYPLKLLVVMMHESGHALATLLVGGRVDRVTLGTDESGACLSAYPPGFLGAVLVYSAGYLGSLIAGATLVTLSIRLNLARAVTWAMAGWLALMAVLYAGSFFTLAFCVGTAVALALAAKLLPPRALELMNLFIAGFSALYAVLDIRDDLWNTQTRGRSDAALLADLTHVPALFWAGLWSVLALGVLVVFLRLALVRTSGGPRAPASGAKPAAARSR